MKASLIFLSALSTASAFTTTTPSPAKSTALSVKFDLDSPGAVDLRGQKFEYDPLRLAETYKPFLPWFQECELRHGRTAMLAAIGFVATDYFRLPGEMYSFEAIPKTIDAHDALLKTGPMYQLLLWIGLFDIIITAPAAIASQNGQREPGNYGLEFGKPRDKETFAKKRASELLNGRLAMIAVGGIATQSVITGGGFPYF